MTVILQNETVPPAPPTDATPTATTPTATTRFWRPTP